MHWLLLLMAVTSATPTARLPATPRVKAPPGKKVRPPDPKAKAADPAESSKAIPTRPAKKETEKQDVAPPTQQEKHPFSGLGRTPTEQQQLDDLSRALREYRSQSQEFRTEIQALVQKKYDDKRAALGSSYEKALRDMEVLERKERFDAIAQFEEFLERYPKEPRYSPDVIFRLAELYYERSADDQALAMRTYEEKMRALPENATHLPPEPQVDFAPSIALYRRLLKDFPEYRLNDGATYLLAYCLEKSNHFDEGQAAYEQLIARYPHSKFATEAWVRIGEYYFDSVTDPNALPQAARAYEAAVTDTQHPLFDKALYKLGWTYYRMDRFDESVARFLQLVDYYAKRAKEKGEDVGGDLRGEALQYAAISLSDEKWGGLDKAQALFASLGGKPYEAEVYRLMGDVLFDQTRHAEAVAAYRLVLERDPTGKDAPQIQQRIVQAYERDRKMDDSFLESTKLGTLFGPGSVWYEKHKGEPELIAKAQDLAEKSLYSSAIYHHQQALQLKKDGKLPEAKVAFELAARGYATYLERFPRSKNAYEMEFYWAECLYNSGQFLKASDHYVAIRDSTADTKFLGEAAFSAVLAFQKEVESQVKAGQLPNLEPLRSSERPEGASIAPVPLSPLEKRLVDTSDLYVDKVKENERTPNIAYKAAELFYAHQQFEEARRRFEEILIKYPRAEVAQYATNLIVESFLITKDWKRVEEVSARLAARSQVIDPKSDLYKNLVKFKLAGRFKLADELFAQGDYDGAAAKYIQLVDEEPKHEFADKALNNAAVAYEKTRRFDSALKLYERVFKEYPQSKLADGALFRVAVNAENSYDFDKAVQNYQKLVHDYPASKDREAALFNAARLLEAQQHYREAAAAFLRYADLFPKTDDAPKNQYRAALIFEKQGDWRGEVTALTEFVKKFNSNPNQRELLVDAHKRMGDAEQKLGSTKDAQREFQAATAEFDRHKLKPESNPLGAEAAAQARFQIAEQIFKEFDALKIGGRGKALEKSFSAKRAAVKKVNDAFAQVFPYKRLEWTLAALYRRGNALERFANTIIETPIPPDVKRLGEEATVAYQDLLAQQTATLEDKAVESYAATLAEARKSHISNVWTRRTLEALNRFRPKEYPVLKEPKALLSQQDTYPDGLVLDLAGSRSPPKPPEAPKPSVAPPTAPAGAAPEAPTPSPPVSPPGAKP